MRRSDYATLSVNTEMFVDFINNSLNRSLHGSKEYTPDQFGATAGYLNLFESFPIVADLEEIKEMKEAMEISKKRGGFFSSTKYMQEAAAIIVGNTRPLVTILRERAQQLKKEKNPSKKDTMIQLIRKYNNIRTDLNEVANEYGYDFSEAGDRWFKHYKQHHTSLLGILNEFKSRDPDIEGERGFYEAYKKLTKKYDLNYSIDVRDQIDSLMSSCEDVEKFIGVVKVDYSIKEDEIGVSEEVKRLEDELSLVREELERTQELNVRMLEYLISPPTPPKQGTPGFRQTDLREVEEFVLELSGIMDVATEAEDSELLLNFPIDKMEEIFRGMRSALDNTEYLPLFAQVENVLGNISYLGRDKKRLRDVTRQLMKNIKFEIDEYHRKEKRRKELEQHL
jgi:hypothetical protein